MKKLPFLSSNKLKKKHVLGEYVSERTSESLFGWFGVKFYPKPISVSNSCSELKSVDVMSWARYEE
jgi:hypothetical protein